MKKYLLITLSALFLAPAVCRAGKVKSFDGSVLSIDSTGIAAPRPSPDAAAFSAGSISPQFTLPQKAYTVMLFMNGKNSLSNMMARKMVELEQLGSDDNVNIVMQLGLKQLAQVPGASSGTFTYPYGASWEGVRRYYVMKNPQKTWTIKSSVRFADPANTDMGDYRSLVDFAKWAKTNFPAQKYILVIGNHGGAWLDKPKTAATPARGVSYDDLTKNYITTPEIGLALRELGGADILIFDDCLMQAAEVASEVGTTVKFIAGSEEISYTNHFTPAVYFAPLKLQPSMSPETFIYQYKDLVAAHMTKLWTDTGKYPGTASILFTAKTAGLQPLVRDYAAAAMDLVESSPEAKAAYIAAMKEALHYYYPYCADFYDFLRLAQEKVAAGPLAGSEKARRADALAENIKNYISQDLTPYNFAIGNADGKDYSRSHGVTVYVPAIKAGQVDGQPPTFLIASEKLQTKYTDLSFDKATGWSRFIKTLTAK